MDVLMYILIVTHCYLFLKGNTISHFFIVQNHHNCTMNRHDVMTVYIACITNVQYNEIFNC